LNLQANTNFYRKKMPIAGQVAGRRSLLKAALFVTRVINSSK